MKPTNRDLYVCGNIPNFTTTRKGMREGGVLGREEST